MLNVIAFSIDSKVRRLAPIQPLVFDLQVRYFQISFRRVLGDYHVRPVTYYNQNHIFHSQFTNFQITWNLKYGSYDVVVFCGAIFEEKLFSVEYFFYTKK